MRMLQTLIAAMVMASVVAVAEAAPQTHAPPVGQDPEKIVQGQVKEHRSGRDDNHRDGQTQANNTVPLRHYMCLPDTADPRGPKGK
jgi:hypothetical protein